MTTPHLTHTSQSSPQDGFALVGMIVAIFIILLALSVAAPTVARALRREREVEAVHRANEYVNAIRRYHLKTNTYPGSLDQLEKTNNVRYLRQKYNNPMTGKPDWRLIKVGENKTTVKGFFGQPLAGLASTGIGGGSPSSSPSSAGTSTNPVSGSGSGAGSSPLSSGPNSAGIVADTSGTDAIGPGASNGLGSNTGVPGGSTTGSSGIAHQSASSFSGGGSPFLGVGLPTAGSAIIVVNEQTTYPEWEFLYDPRIEQLRSKVNLFGGGVSSTSSSSLGSLSNNQSNQPGSNPSTSSTPTTTTSPQ